MRLASPLDSKICVFSATISKIPNFKSHTIKIEDIEKFKAMSYSPLKEYGGWGIRFGFKGKAYNVSGNKGVKVFLKNDTNIMFGSQKYKELEKTLKKIKKQ